MMDTGPGNLLFSQSDGPRSVGRSVDQDSIYKTPVSVLSYVASHLIPCGTRLLQGEESLEWRNLTLQKLEGWKDRG
ncbi:MAG: hypothetical protein AB1898_15990 [Acidobacteriota bacterium]